MRLSNLLWFAMPAVTLCPPCVAQTYYWSAFAGRPPQIGSADGAGTAARFALPWALVSDVSGVTYVAEASGDRIRRISPTGSVTTLAGAGLRGGVDGVGAGAHFAAPSGLTLANGFLFVADRGNHAIRRVSGNGTVTTFAGRLGLAGSADGGPGSARFNEPIGITFDAANNLYIADSRNHAIRKITPEGEVTTVAGMPGVSGSADGAATVARFNFPTAICLGPAGSLYVSDSSNHTVRRISADGTVTTIAGSPGEAGTANGTGSAARFFLPAGLLVYGDGTVIVCDSGNDCIRVITPAGLVGLHTGRIDVPGSRDGARAEARFFVPTGLAFSPDGVLVADSRNHSIRKISNPNFDVSLFAGPGGNFGRQDGVGPEALFNYPLGVGVHSSGDVYLADARGNTIRRITPQGLVTTLVTGGEELYADGPADVARVNYPVGIAVAEDRTVFFCEQQRQTVRALRPDGSLVTLAGSPGATGTTDGVGSAARFTFPSGIALDREGNLYVSDSISSTVRRIVIATGAVSTFAGAALQSGSADGPRGTNRLRFPQGLATDADGNVYVADWGNHAIRRISPEGNLSTLAGLAGTPGAANGTGSAARFNFPAAIAADSAGQLFVGDASNNIIRKIVGTTVTTIGGSAGSIGYSDGAGSAATFGGPEGIAVDANGTIYVSESGNNVVRRGEILRAPAISAQPRSLVVSSGSSATLTVSATGGALFYQWRFNGVAISGATASSYTINAISPALAGTYSVIIANSVGSVTSESAVVTISTASDAGRITNLSILSSISAPGDSFTLGFVLGGNGASGTKPLLIRAAGPSLGALGVAGALDDPKFDLFFGGATTGGNDNWGGSPALVTAMTNVGAFAYTAPNSRDAATAADFQLGNNSVRVAAAGSGTGDVIAEIYDATPAATFTAATPRLINVSVLKHIGSGLTAGFAIGGRSAKTVLIRAIGPTLAAPPFDVGGALDDPQLTLFAGSTPVGANDNWGGTPGLTTAFNQVGAFQLPAASRDAALLTTLSPGTYTVRVSGVADSTGVALIEIYDVP